MIDFSIVIPIYNAEESIEECVMSFVNQDRGNYTFEIILVNDGSTDGSLKKCEKLASKFQFIRVINKQNEGCVIARKVGVLASQGDFIIHCDADDVVRNDMLPKVSNVLDNHDDVDLVVFDLQKVQQGVLGKIVSQPFLNPGKFDISEALSTVCRCSSFNSVVIKCCKKTVITKCFEACEDLHENIGEDLQITSRLFIQDLKGYYLPEPLYFYRENLNSVTHVCPKVKAINGFLISHHYIYNLLKDRNDISNLTNLYGYVIRELVYFWCMFLNITGLSRKEINEAYKKIFSDELAEATECNISNAKIAFWYKILYWLLMKRNFSVIKFIGKIM